MSGGVHSHAYGPLSPGDAGPARRAALASVGVALALSLAKLWGAYATGSVAMAGSLADSVLDLVASLITLGGVAWAARPADHDHRFGHGKAEALAALTQGGLMLVSGGVIGVEAVRRLLDPAPIEQPELAVAISAAAIGLTVLLLGFQRRAIARTGSVAVAADRLHYQGDLAVNIAVIAALGLEWLGLVRGADGLFGFGIALYLLWMGRGAAVGAVDLLMDREWPDDARQRLLRVAATHPLVRGVHDLRTRGAGQHHFAQFHIWVDPEMTVGAAHDVVDAVEARVRDAFPGVGVLVHVDPTGHRDTRPPHG